MKIAFLSNRETHMKGIFAELNREEALRLAMSLMGQIKTNNPNTERVEFFPQSSKCNYFTVGVTPEPTPPNLYKILHEIEEEMWEAIPKRETTHTRGIRKGMDKAWRIIRSRLMQPSSRQGQRELDG